MDDPTSSKGDSPAGCLFALVLLIVLGGAWWLWQSGTIDLPESTTTSRPRPTMASSTYPEPTTRPATTRRTTTTVSQRELDDLKFGRLLDHRQQDGSFDWFYPSDLANLGRAVCEDLLSGRSAHSLIPTLARDFSQRDAATFIVVAAEVYCPQYDFY
ncbi:MAG: DUF732 domain-containing protein [bacterium]|nr:DUF732 domain-containing protein [bacterium]MDE0353317.1 DUF732 domain-containing protein [bacterium]